MRRPLWRVPTAGDGTPCPTVGNRYRDWKKGGHGDVDLDRAIVESCDVFFYRLSVDLGIERIRGTLVDFGIGVPTGIDLSGESSGLAPSPAWKEAVRGQPWYPGETLITGIGQGYTLATPLASSLPAASALGTHGVRMRPQVVLRRESGDGGGSEILTPEIAGDHQDRRGRGPGKPGHRGDGRRGSTAPGARRDWRVRAPPTAWRARPGPPRW